jgi:isoaspartyl peptidase/L-asparaginase-like protein (Ntn-hydrolase superfamily)
VSPRHRTGTVGAVALDKHGDLAAASSTGGYPGKVSGRVGDTPIAGAGNYANKRVAISSSGIGEYFIRYNIGHTVASRMEYLGEPLDVAAQRTFDSVYENEGLKNVDVAQCLRDRALPDCQEIDKIVQRFHALGIGGVIALDKDGNLLEYFRFSAFARGYRMGSDTSATVHLQ